MAPWTYDNTLILSTNQIPTGVIGFVYIITHTPSGKKYIGKKNLYNERRIPMGKRELKAWTKPGTKPKKKVSIKESNWKSYYSSNAWILEQVKNGHDADFKREILQWCYTKIDLTYQECRYQFIHNVLKDDNYLNDNILGKFYKGKV